MSTQNAPHRTRTSNATTRTGQIVLDAKIKRCTKAQKAADDLALKEAQEAQVQKGLECLAGMQNEMEKAQEELLNKKAIPVQPKPRAHKATKPVARSGGDHTDNMLEADEANDLREAVETMEATDNMEDGTTGANKRKVIKKGGKALIKDAISNMQKKINEPSSKLEGDNANNMARVSDGKDTPAPFNATTQEFALGGRVTNWISGVKPGKSEPMSRTSSTSFPTQAPPSSIFSQGTASTAATSDAQVPIRKPAAPVAEALIGNFADDIDDTLECEATIVQGKGKSKVASIFEDNMDFDEPNAPPAYESDDDSVTSFTEQERYSQEPRAPFTQIENHGTLKRKASVDDVFNNDEESMVSDWSMDIEGPDFEDTFEPEPEPPVEVKKEKDPCKTFSTSVSVVTAVPASDSKPPAPKKIKVEASAARARGTKHQLNVDTVPDNMKPRSAYCNIDLPATLQVDQRWAKKYLPTFMLWAGSYEDLWTIPDDILLLHAQLIFNAVFKELNITIVHGGVIHSLTAQRISEWHSNFSLTGLVIIMDFLSRNSDCNSVQLATHLLADYAFLFEDPDKPSPLMTYRSPFVLQLLGTAHLNAISGYVDIPDLDTHTLATRAIRMSGVIALCAAAIERALGMFMNKNLKVKDILVTSCRGKLVIKLPKVLNKVTGKMTNALFLFSAARWGKVTASFIKSISSKPAGTHLTTTSQRTMSVLCFDVVSSTTPPVESRCHTIIIFTTIFAPTCPPFFLYPQLALDFCIRESP
ncbi:hypothetical protein BDR05DRAFT_1003678 [Suillus weaverae]|nr:hypothetical protein BDR05DRAFT_1003678 [Suillus weaverae]